LTQYDVIIAGAGIVGLATGLKMLEKRPQTQLLIIEKEDGPARHQSGHNSGVIHSGIYYKPGSLKAVNCRKGYNQLLDFCNKENIRYDICGKVISATREKELPYLETLYERGLANGLDNIRMISRDELTEIEPHAYGLKAIHVPYTGIIDFKDVCAKYAELISKNTGIIYNEKVSKIHISGKSVEVITNKNTYTAGYFVNCCGLYSDKVGKLTGSSHNIRVIPFRGEYYTLKEDRNFLVRSLIYPVPDPDFPFLGVHFTRTIDGKVEAGPNAVLSFKREGYNKSSFNFGDTLNTFSWPGFQKVALRYYKVGMGEFYRSFFKKAFVNALQKLLPGIRENDLEPGGSGVRAQAIARNGKLIDDFIIDRKERIINVLNAPSPAATSSLSIGDAISDEIISNFT
jgi:L-2-hydroxyglutarate oxidase